jgi:hypothetical protein
VSADSFTIAAIFVATLLISLLGDLGGMLLFGGVLAVD